MAKQNCWEFKKCGRQPGGPKAAELGVCMAATDATLAGQNGGKAAGRICWKIAGSMSPDKKRGVFSAKLLTCLACDFYSVVQAEEKK
ncbi:MAG: hypothetical protein JW809_12950 [Pirellulales bacterium]|nr:hypothetical protein [Pirellulales bacterium]